MKHPLLSGVIAVPTETNIPLLQQHSLLMLPPNQKKGGRSPSAPLPWMPLGSSDVVVQLTEMFELLSMLMDKQLK